MTSPALSLQAPDQVMPDLISELHRLDLADLAAAEAVSDARRRLAGSYRRMCLETGRALPQLFGGLFMRFSELEGVQWSYRRHNVGGPGPLLTSPVTIWNGHAVPLAQRREPAGDSHLMSCLTALARVWSALDHDVLLRLFGEFATSATVHADRNGLTVRAQPSLDTITGDVWTEHDLVHPEHVDEFPEALSEAAARHRDIQAEAERRAKDLENVEDSRARFSRHALKHGIQAAFARYPDMSAVTMVVRWHPWGVGSALWAPIVRFGDVLCRCWIPRHGEAGQCLSDLHELWRGVEPAAILTLWPPPREAEFYSVTVRRDGVIDFDCDAHAVYPDDDHPYQSSSVAHEPLPSTDLDDIPF